MPSTFKLVDDHISGHLGMARCFNVQGNWLSGQNLPIQFKQLKFGLRLMLEVTNYASYFSSCQVTQNVHTWRSSPINLVL